MKTSPSFSLLCLGDSYTIGEGLPLHESYPFQAVQLLRRAGRQLQAPEIIAQTGWTTGELDALLDQTMLLPHYDFVSLLIGVNNQYRGMLLQDYALGFKGLLLKAIGFAGGQVNNVVVLSIPDWGIAPFAAGRDLQKIAGEIDRFNEAASGICAELGVTFINITTQQRLHGAGPEWLAADGLHPSGNEYRRWGGKLAAFIAERISED